MFGDGFGARTDLELFVNAPDMRVDGVVTDMKGVSDLFVEKAFGEMIEHFLFAGRQALRAASRRGMLKGSDNLSGDVAGHRRTAALHIANGSEQFSRRCLFEQIARGAGSQRP